MIDRAAWREVLRRTGKTERRGGYPRSWRGVGQVFADLVDALPVLDLALGRGQFSGSGSWLR